MDKMREDFECFVAKGAIAPSRFQESITVEQRTFLLGLMFNGNEYIEDEIQSAYEIWKLSRASLVVDLPEPEVGEGALVWLPNVEVALDNAGVSYK